MAKGKHATALFEVISRSKRYQKPADKRSGSSWWPFARKRVEPIIPAEVLVNPVSTAPPPARRAVIDQASCHATRSQPTPVIPISEPMDAPPDAYLAGEDDIDPLPTVTDPLKKPLDVALDYDRKVIAFRMNYTVAIVGGFALVVAIALAVIVGQHMRGEAAPALTSSIKAIQSSKVQPGILEVNKARGKAGISSDGAAPAAQQQPMTPRPAPTFNEPRPPANFTAASDGKRYIGFNYTIIQSYASTEEKLAQDACEFLNKHGVACTIEKGLKGWPPSNFIIVGTRPFDRISTQPYKDYEASIQKVSQLYAGSAKNYKAFQPSPKKWDKQG